MAMEYRPRARRFHPIQILCLVVMWLASSLVLAQTPEKRLRLYNWEDYMPQTVLEAFEAKTGYRVDVVPYESDELKDELLQSTGGEGLDLLIGSAASFQAYVQQGGVLATLENLPNLTHIDARWSTQHEGLKAFAAPYLWGTLGIAYRKDKVTQPVTSWRALLEPEPALKGKILMIEDMRDLFTPALKLAGYSVNETDAKAINRAGDFLEKQKPYVAAYQYLDITEASELLKGTAWMALAYNGDAIALAEMSDQIAFVVPDEGTNIWVDYIAVLESSRQKEVARAFIDFINQPEIAAQIASELYYASPNQAARALLSADMLENPLIYPPPSVLDKSESVQPIQGRAAVFFNHRYGNLMN